MASEDHVHLRMLPLKRRTPNWLDVRVLCSRCLLRELRATGMNLLSGTTWKGAKLRIGEAKPDFRERYDTSHICGIQPIKSFILTTIESNARTRHLQTTGKQKNVGWLEAFKASTPRICPSSPLKMSLHDLVGVLRLWVGSFVRCECGRGNPFRLCLS